LMCRCRGCRRDARSQVDGNVLGLEIEGMEVLCVVFRKNINISMNDELYRTFIVAT